MPVCGVGRSTTGAHPPATPYPYRAYSKDATVGASSKRTHMGTALVRQDDFHDFLPHTCSSTYLPYLPSYLCLPPSLRNSPGHSFLFFSYATAFEPFLPEVFLSFCHPDSVLISFRPQYYLIRGYPIHFHTGIHFSAAGCNSTSLIPPGPISTAHPRRTLRLSTSCIHLAGRLLNSACSDLKIVSTSFLLCFAFLVWPAA